jgi:hypothetical protein
MTTRALTDTYLQVTSGLPVTRENRVLCVIVATSEGRCQPA